MSSWKSDEKGLGSEPLSDAARDDWTRYGLSRRQPATDAAAAQAIVRPIRPEDRHGNFEGHVYLEYQHENVINSGRPARTARGRRFVANVATVSIVGVIGGLIAVLGSVTAG